MFFAVLFGFLVLANGETLQVLNPNAVQVSRIIGGTATTIETYPYIVQVLYNLSASCGGSILTTRHVMTAAHCLVTESGQLINPSLLAVRAGTTYVNSGGIVRYVSTTVIHEQYNTPQWDNDIAVMVLSRSLSYSTMVQPSTIPVQDFALGYNQNLTVLGWGRTSVNVASMSPILMRVDVDSINHTVCSQRYQSINMVVTNNMICSGLLNIGGADACLGDSGGPVVFRNVVVGITSWGSGCADPTYPGVNARVSSYTNWINATVTKYSKASPVHTTSLSLIMGISYILLFVIKS